MANVHTEHCCIRHGCKYRDTDCPVETGKEKQYYLCEDCKHASESVPPALLQLYLEITGCSLPEFSDQDDNSIYEHMLEELRYMKLDRAAYAALDEARRAVMNPKQWADFLAALEAEPKVHTRLKRLFEEEK